VTTGYHGHAMAKPVLFPGLLSRRISFGARSVRVGFVVCKVALGQVSLFVIRLLPCEYHCTSAPYSSSSTFCDFQKEKRPKPTIGTFHSKSSFEIGGEFDLLQLKELLKLVCYNCGLTTLETRYYSICISF
jgi:hypothetical protein